MWRYITTITIAGLLFLSILAVGVVIAPDTVHSLIIATLYIATIGLGIFIALTLLIGAATGLERYRMSRATRRATENEAALTVIDVPADHRAFTYHHDNATFHNLSLDPRRVITGDNGPTPTDDEYRTWGFYHQSLHATPRVVGSDPMLPEETAIDILTALQRTPRGLIVGASDAGKSTILSHLSEQASRQGNVIVIDPHSAPGKWPNDCTVIGTGSRHDRIELALDKLVDLMVKRYQEIGRGKVQECGHPRVTIIVDEWMAIAEQCSNAKATLVRLLTESRKAAFAVYVGSHSDRVRSLGLDGRGDLRDGFEIYHLEIDQRTGARRAWLEVDGNETPLTLPGPYAPGSTNEADDLQPLRLLDAPPDAPLAPEPGSLDERVCQMKEDGASMRQITQAVFGDGKFGDHWNQQIYTILDRYGVSR